MAGHHEDLKRAIRAARNKANIKSDQELALRAGVHLQTIQNWMYGNTVPRPSELSKVAQALDVSMADLMAVYEGRDPEPPSLQDAIRELVAVMAAGQQNAYLERITVAIEKMAGITPDPAVSPGDSTMLREIAAEGGRSRTRPRERRPQSVTG